MSEKTVQVPGISCGHCVMTIEREVGELPGVAAVEASAESKLVTVRWDNAKTSWEDVVELLKEIDFPPAESPPAS